MPEPAQPNNLSGLRLAEAIATSEDAGDGQFQAAPGGEVRCLTCHRTSPASDHRADDVRRVEGVSDPADMALVTTVRCPHCGATGALILRYGPEASEDEADLLTALDRDAGHQPGTPRG